MANPKFTINLSADNTSAETVNQNVFNPKTDSAVSDYSHVPEDMKQLPHWVVAAANKLPINPASGHGAKSNDPSTWNTFDVCLSYLKENYGKEVTIGNQKSSIEGLGFMFQKENGLVGIDIDHCLDADGNIVDERVKAILDANDGYAEVSKSRSGIHIISRGQKNFSSNKMHLTDEIVLEVYDSARYFFITGNLLSAEKAKITDGQALLDYISKEFFSSSNEKSSNIAIPIEASNEPAVISEEVMERLEYNLKSDEYFNRRWNGERFKGDESSDDMSLLCSLAHITHDRETIKALFIQSPYFDSKDADHQRKVIVREDYIIRSINKAIEYAECNLDPEEALLLEYDFTDDGNADRFIHLYGDKISYCQDENLWYVYNGKFWEADIQKTNMMKLTKELANTMKMITKTYVSSDSNYGKQLQQAVKRLGNISTKQSMITASQCEVARLKKDYNTRRDILIVKNGVVDLRTGELLDFSPEYYSTQAVVDINYNPKAGEATRFLQFLDEIFAGDKELTEYVLRFLGYCLTGEVKESKFLICYGSGANGKSVLFNLIRDIMGMYSDSMSTAGILKKRNSDAPNTSVMKIRDTRMVTIDELQKNDELDTALVKNITGGASEKINVREMYGRAQSFEFAFKLVMNTNFLPRLNWLDNAMNRRVVVIPFDVVFTDEKQDRSLPYKLQQEKEQILSLLIAKAKEYYENGLPEIPEASKAAFKKATIADCPLKAYFDEEIDITQNSDDMIQAQRFYESYCAWCYAHDFQVDDMDSQTSVGRRMKHMHGIVVKQDGYHRVQYYGMKFKNHAAETESEKTA